MDLPVIINLNARSLSIEKLDELNVTVGIHDVSVLFVTETWLNKLESTIWQESYDYTSGYY